MIAGLAPAGLPDDPVGEAVYIPDLDLPAGVFVVDEQLELRQQGVGEIPGEGSQQNGFG